MPDVSCPSCGHRFPVRDASSSAPASAPDPSVVRWFATDASWLGELSTDEAYRGYLRATDQPPVSRARFVADLAHLGVEKVLDDDTAVLVRT